MRILLGAGLVVCSLSLTAAPPAKTVIWLDQVGPIVTQAERKTYLALPPADRAKFEDDFWASHAITKEEYFRRLSHVDAMWGSDKAASGANTDPGRVYLAIGPPTKVTRIPSSRTFVPLEIWYYDNVPGILSTELRLIFYRAGSLGLPKLYSPTTDTIRALLVPQASNVHLFGPNDSLTEADVRGALKTGPAEDETITAAVGIAAGVKYSGADAILGQISSPQFMLSRPPESRVSSRLITAHPDLTTLVTASEIAGALQVDLRLEASARASIDLEVFGAGEPSQPGSALTHSHLNLQFTGTRPIAYLHRLDLLPGKYRLVFSVDEVAFTFPLMVPVKPAMGEILRAEVDADPSRVRSPFGFGGRRIDPDPDGRSAAVAVAGSGRVTWIIRHGSEVVWRTAQEAETIAVVELPTSLPAGNYRLEAVTADDSRSTALRVPMPAAENTKRTQISWNANLADAQRLSFVAHQLLIASRPGGARQLLEAGLRRGNSAELQNELVRVEILDGKLDAARDRVRHVLQVQPDNFEALSLYAGIEAGLQDFPVAAELYRRALKIQDSPEIRTALAGVIGR